MRERDQGVAARHAFHDAALIGSPFPTTKGGAASHSHRSALDPETRGNIRVCPNAPRCSSAFHRSQIDHVCRPGTDVTAPSDASFTPASDTS